MSAAFPPQDLQCPDPDGCTVAVAQLAGLAGSSNLPEALLPSSRHWFRVYDARDGFGQPNPGFGDTRFAPFDAMGSGHRVPTLYLAQTLESALLETSLHNVTVASRVVAEISLLGKLHAQVMPPRELLLADLRDEQLQALGLDRTNIASSSSEHYPCTRQVARAIHAEGRLDGIIWHSRQAELAQHARSEVVVVFADRVPADRGQWSLLPARDANGSLLEGAGRLLLDQLAESLGVTIVAEPRWTTG